LLKDKFLFPVLLLTFNNVEALSMGFGFLFYIRQILQVQRYLQSSLLPPQVLLRLQEHIKGSAKLYCLARPEATVIRKGVVLSGNQLSLKDAIYETKVIISCYNIFN